MYYETKSIYLSSSVQPGSTYLTAVDAHGSLRPYSLRPTTFNLPRWTVAKNASGSRSSMTASVVATVFTTRQKPEGTTFLTTNGPGWVFGPYTGVFPYTTNATMSVQFDYWASVVSAQQGRVQFRFWRANDLAGTGASILSPVIQTNIIVVNATGNRTTGVFPLTSSLVLKDEYIFLEAAWAITTAAGSNTANVIFRAGSGSFIRTGPFEDNTFIPLSDDDIAGFV